ncbi:MAG TPA: hypothetical protein VGS19_20610 [Streptosporangiaceae bacterium]|nr:hypothetical protein [Streptosporangiaceae bacterium]
MEQHAEKRRYLARLAEELAKRELTAELTEGTKHPSVKVANPDVPDLNERVLCDQADDGSWCYWWPWRQPIGSVDDLETVVGRVAWVLRSVEAL